MNSFTRSYEAPNIAAPSRAAIVQDKIALLRTDLSLLCRNMSPVVSVNPKIAEIIPVLDEVRYRTKSAPRINIAAAMRFDPWAVSHHQIINGNVIARRAARS